MSSTLHQGPSIPSLRRRNGDSCTGLKPVAHCETHCIVAFASKEVFKAGGQIDNIGALNNLNMFLEHTALVPCWGRIKNDHVKPLLEFNYNKNVKLYPTRIQCSSVIKTTGAHRTRVSNHSSLHQIPSRHHLVAEYLSPQTLNPAPQNSKP